MRGNSDRMALGFYPTFTVVLVMIFLDYTHSSKYHEDNWVDPDDIMNYDRASKTMVSADKASKLQDDDWVDPVAGGKSRSGRSCYNDEHAKKVLDFQEKLSKCEKRLTKQEANRQYGPSPQATNPTTPQNPSVETVFMKRFVALLLTASGLSVGPDPLPGETRRGDVALEVEAAQLELLRRYGSDGSVTSLAQLDEVLSSAIRVARLEEGYFAPLGWLERFKHFFSETDLFYRLTPYALSIVVVLMMLFRRSPLKILATFLTLALPLSYHWTYDYLVKVAEIEQFLEMKKYDDEPPACRPPGSVYEYLTSMLLGNGDKECRQFYVARMMPAALPVTPTIVLSEMVASMLVHPMGKVGAGIGSFTSGVLDGLSFWQGLAILPFVLTLIATVATVIGVVVLGGRLRLPSWFGSFELIGRQPNFPNQIHTTHRVQEITQPAQAYTNTPPPNNPVNVNIYLDSNIFTGPREAVQQLALANSAIEIEKRTREAVEQLVVTNSAIELEKRTREAVEQLVVTGSLIELEERPREAVEQLVVTDSSIELEERTREGVEIIGLKMEREGRCSEGRREIKDTAPTSTGAVDSMYVVNQNAARKEPVLDSQPSFLETIELILDQEESLPSDSDPDNSDPDVSYGTSNTEFITSIEAILLESSVDVMAAGDSAAVAVEDAGRKLDRDSLIERTLLESSVDGMAARDSAAVAVEDAKRKVSRDSSDGSGDFVKL